MNYVLKTEDFEWGVLTSAYNKKGDYIGDEETAKYLTSRGIEPELRTPNSKVCSIGFSKNEQKWYGWSHRAIYGFGIGSEVKKGDCGYVGATPEDMIEDRVAFFSDLGKEKAELVRAECQILPDRSGICILHAPCIIPMVSSIEEAFDPDGKFEMVDINRDAVSIEKCGRGEWMAKTLEDAKQMACDFAEGVS